MLIYRKEGKKEKEMITQQEKSRVTQMVGRIKDTLDTFAPNNIDTLKVSVEIFNEMLDGMREDVEIADNMRSYWTESADGAEK